MYFLISFFIAVIVYSIVGPTLERVLLERIVKRSKVRKEK
jgi:hypothetical protein